MANPENEQTNLTVGSPQRTVLPTAVILPRVLALPTAALRTSVADSVGPSVAALEALTVGQDVAPTDGEAALQRIGHLLAAILDGDMLPRVNTSVRNAAITALGALQRIVAIRPDAVRLAPNHNLIYLDFFEDILLAMLHTDTAVQMHTEDKKELTAKAEILFGKRDQFESLARGLARFGQMDARQLEVVGKEGGYKALARDISILVTAFRQSWDKVGRGLPFTLQDLAQLDRDATALNIAIGQKEQNPEAPREVTVRRRRVFTLFRMAVADIRRLAIYLYGEDAVDDIIPSFSNFTHGGRNTGAQEETTTPSEAAANATAPVAEVTTTVPRPSGFVVNNPENLPITPPFAEEEDVKETA